jgi:hypothetical protein
MLYQLSLYAASHDGKIATILYPTHAPEAAEERLNMSGAHGGTRLTVVLRPVFLPRIEDLINAPFGDRREKERAKFAAALLGES